MTTNPYAEAIEAARLALQDRTGRTRQSTQRDAETAVDAATPRLLAPIRALADDLASQETDTGDPDMDDAYQSADRDAARRIREALDAIEGARDE